MDRKHLPHNPLARTSNVGSKGRFPETTEKALTKQAENPAALLFFYYYICAYSWLQSGPGNNTLPIIIPKVAKSYSPLHIHDVPLGSLEFQSATFFFFFSFYCLIPPPTARYVLDLIYALGKRTTHCALHRNRRDGARPANSRMFL